MNVADFRSDTVTWPTEEMREAMARAELGDDVYGEDPTVNRLQEEAAGRVGKEAGLFVASGTMGNLAAILAHAGRGDEVILGSDAHVFLWEAGGMAVLGGVVPCPVPTDSQGRMNTDEIAAHVREDDPHLPHSRLILTENTYGSRGGVALPPEYLAAVGEVARNNGLAVHLDGARLFNAAVALGRPAAELAAHADSVTFCLSKGLCAPAGSVLCGSRPFIARARRVRKLLGGGMRQAGVLAAAGRVALREMIDRLVDDHRRAFDLARGLDAVDGIRCEPMSKRTNMVYFGIEEGGRLGPAELIAALQRDTGIRLGAEGRRLRAVTHRWITDDHVLALVNGVRAALAG